MPYDKPTLNEGEPLFRFKTDEVSYIKTITPVRSDIEVISHTNSTNSYYLNFNIGLKANASWAATYNQRFEYDITVGNGSDTALENRKIKIIIQGAAMPYNAEGTLIDPNLMMVRTNSPINLSLNEVSEKGNRYAFTTENQDVVKVELHGNYQAHWRYIDSKGKEHQLLSGYVKNGAIIYASKLWLDPGYNPILNSATYDVTVNDKISTIVNYTK